MALTIGMRDIARSHCRSHHWPKMLVTNMPETSITATITSTLSPGMWRKDSMNASAPTGATAWLMLSSHENMPSIRPSSHSSTQMVMASGSQTSRPAMMYLRTGWVIEQRAQWQAQPPPQDVDGAALVAPAPAPASGVPAAAAGAPAAPPAAPAAAGASGAAGAAGAAPLPLKSVAYQPEPLSWKPAAVTCLVNDSAPQAGQVLSTASDSFCNTSFAWPQAEIGRAHV